MKKIFVVILCVITAFVACTNKTANSTNEADTSYEDSLYAEIREREIEDSLIRESHKYINSVKGHKEEYLITGRFVDNSVDTLWFECPDEDNRDVWELCCSNKAVKRCKFWGVSPRLVFEGDLDGNGTDDFGFIDTWHTSNCRNYHVATIRNPTIISMLQFETAYSLRASGKKLVKKSNRKGYAHVICSDMEAPGSCCNRAPDVDTLIRFDYQKFDQSDFK